MTVMAIAYSSQPTPRPASIEEYWEAMITPASADVKPEIENSSTVVRPPAPRGSGQPVGFWPMEKIQLPVRRALEEQSRQTIGATRNHSTDIRKPPEVGPGEQLR